MITQTGGRVCSLRRVFWLSVAGFLSAQAYAATWVGSVGSFTNAANWDTGVPAAGQPATVANGGTAQFDGGTAAVGTFSLGDVAGSSGAFEMLAGTLTNNLFYVGNTGTGGVTQTGGDIMVTAVADPSFGVGFGVGGVGSYAMSDGSLSLLVGNGNFQVGGRGIGAFTQTGGAVTGNQWMVLGRYAPGGNGTVTVAGGTFNQINANNRLIVGEEMIGHLTVTNAGVVNLSGGLRVGMNFAGSTGTVWLSQGGVISTPEVLSQGGRSTFNFDGGTLVARGAGVNNGAFFQGLSSAYVRGGGALIDSGNNAITVTQNLLDGGGTGGLTKLGSGLLTLGGANTYAGNTAVSGGILSALKPGSLPGYDQPGRVSVSAGGGLAVGVSGAGAWSDAQIATTRANVPLSADSFFGYDTTGGNFTNSANIGWSHGLVKMGLNTLKLTGNNTYTGGSIVYGGVLQADFGAGLPGATNVTLNGGTLSAASGTLSPTLGADAGQVNLVSGSASGFSAFNAPLTVNVGGAASMLQWGGGLFNPSALLLNEVGANQPLTLLNGLDLAGGTRTINVNALGAAVTIAGNVSNSTGTGALTKGGAGDLTLAGTNVYLGLTTVNAGSLTLGPASSNVLGAVTVSGGTLTITNAAGVTAVNGALTVAGAARLNVSGPTALSNAYDFVVGNGTGARGVANVATNLSVRYLKIGTFSPSAGAVYLTGGVLTNMGVAVMGGVDIGESSYGYFRQTDGLFRGNEIAVGYNATGVGVLTLDGGVFAPTPTLYLFCGRNGGTGYIHLNGGELTAPANFGVGWANAAGRGEINVNGGVLNAAAGGFRFMSSTPNNFLNLRGGVFRATTISKTTGTGSSYLNLNGGTVQAAATLLNLIQNLNGAYVYPGGAAIDTTNLNVRVPQSLLAPPGSGVTSVALTGSGAGYIGEPYVVFSGGGGGTGATARAVINPAAGTVTAIQITNPGFGYTTAPTVALAGGGYTAAATLGTVALSANASGGLTKLGSGMLTLAGTNTYAGTTTISNGLLILGVANALPVGASVNVAGGTYSLGGFTVTNGAVTVNGGTIEGGSLNAASVTVTDSGTIDASLAGAASLVKTGAGVLALSGSSSFAGATSIQGGRVQLSSPLKHRWSFNGNALDSAGASPASAIGAVTVGAQQYRLAGGARNTSYISLGANILPTNNAPVTIELWATQHAIQNWSRIFDFGVSQTTNLIMTWTQGTSLTTDRVEVKPNTPAAQGNNTMAPYTLNQEYHIALVITPGAGAGGSTLFKWYKMDAAGATLTNGSMSVNFTLADLIQRDMWLGHSQYNDNDASASYNEVRIWNAALTQEQLAANSVLGPDVLPAASVLPVGTAVALSGGATLDLGGHAQSLAGLSGSGLVTNGTLAVSGTVAPGGTNVIGTLTSAASTSLTGTLLTDMAADGSCDLLKVLGSLNVTGATLHIQDLAQLKAGKQYVIASCAPGCLTGRFASTNLDGGRWQVVYRNATGEVRLLSRGLLILIQ